MAKGLIYKTNATTHEPVMDPNQPKVMEFADDAEATEYATVDTARGDRDYAILDLEGLTWNQAPPYEAKNSTEEGDEKKA